MLRLGKHTVVLLFKRALYSIVQIFSLYHTGKYSIQCATLCQPAIKNSCICDDIKAAISDCNIPLSREPGQACTIFNVLSQIFPLVLLTLSLIFLFLS